MNFPLKTKFSNLHGYREELANMNLEKLRTMTSSRNMFDSIVFCSLMTFMRPTILLIL